jgi:hypothetical protein
MTKTPRGTVKETGASPGQILVGIREEPLNCGLRIKVHRRQDPVGARIKGSFDLLDPGTGTYSNYLPQHVGESFLNAADLIDEIRASGGNAIHCTHILNRNRLRIE